MTGHPYICYDVRQSECPLHENFSAQPRAQWRIVRCTHIGDRFYLVQAEFSDGHTETLFDTGFTGTTWDSTANPDEAWEKMLPRLRTAAAEARD